MNPLKPLQPIQQRVLLVVYTSGQVTTIEHVVTRIQGRDAYVIRRSVESLKPEYLRPADEDRIRLTDRGAELARNIMAALKDPSLCQFTA
jgi:coproporphyrinogen III oxidase-like Fe-S oxidoreductase